jgi:ABC-type Fe3+-hydroxamate transport system substrate-binding protein
VIQRIFDDRGRELLFSIPPKRVVSLVPSDTLNVASIGCASALVGRTDYCELPSDVVGRIPSVGGTKNPRVEDILALEPDLVLANQEENTKSDLEKLAQKGLRVYVAFPKSVAEGIAHLVKLARVFGTEHEPAVVELCRHGYHLVRTRTALRERQVRTFCPIWMNPLMTINGRTFISDVLAMAGALNVFADRKRRYPLAADLGNASPLEEGEVAERDTRYPRVTMTEVCERAPELILLPSEPHPFSDADADVFRNQRTPAADRGAIVKTDGKDLCWYGARSIEGLPRIQETVDRFRPS